MIAVRQESITRHFNDWLDRFSPPRRIANDRDALQRDANAMLEIIIRYAPQVGYEKWLTTVLREVEEGMTTRSWPAPGELAAACKKASRESTVQIGTVEAAAIDRMAEWFGKYRNQMPGHGNPARTAELIRRGVLKNEREARFYCFDMTVAMTRVAEEQPMGAFEAKRHHDKLDELQQLAERFNLLREETAQRRASIKPQEEVT